MGQARVSVFELLTAVNYRFIGTYMVQKGMYKTTIMCKAIITIMTMM